MKKITLLFLLLLSVFSYGQQTCGQVFSFSGFYAENPTLTVNATDLVCYNGILNSITIADANLGNGYCFEDVKSFIFTIDGVETRVCAQDIIGMDITNFTTLSISTSDAHGEFGICDIQLLLVANYASNTIPLCNAVMTYPENGAIDILPSNINIEFEPASNATGYQVSVSTANGTNVLSVDVPANQLNIYSVDLPTLTFGTTYYVNILPYNQNGIATEGCTQYSFTTLSLNGVPAGAACEKPITVSLPYYTTDNISNYNYGFYSGLTGNNCGNGSINFDGGGTVVYSYTATFTGSINIQCINNQAGAGIFAYDSCANIGVNCLAGATDFNEGDEFGDGWFNPISLNAFPVTQGSTYYFVLVGSVYPSSPYFNVDYTLNIAENTCTNAYANITVVSAPDCSTSNQFYVQVNVSNLGSASSVVVTDNQSSPSQTMNATGVVTFGPYTNGTEVICKVQNSTDLNCYFYTHMATQGQCPPCDSPIIVTEGEVVTTTFEGGLGSIVLPVWSIYGALSGTEKLFSFTPATTGSYDLIPLYQEVTGLPDLGSSPYFIGMFKIDDGNCTEWGGYPAAMFWDAPTDPPTPLTLTPIGTYGDTQLIAGGTYLLILDAMMNFQTTDLFPDSIASFKIEKHCTLPTVSTTVTSSCPVPQFYANVNITDMGSSSSFTITDNLDSPAQTATQAGTTIFGPYPNGAFPVFTVTPNSGLCGSVTTSDNFYQTHCVGTNDLCGNAFDIACNDTFVYESTFGADLENATSCVGTIGDDVWYRFIGSGFNENIGTVNYSTQNHFIEVYESSNSSCSGITLGNCVASAISTYDDLNENSSAYTSFNSTVDNVYYIRVGSTDANTSIIFNIGIQCLEPSAFPVNDNLCNAIELFMDEPSAGDAYTTLSPTYTSATAELGEPSPSCFNEGATNSVWFSFIAPESGNVKVTTDILGGSLRDTEIAVYDATGVSCNDLSTLGSSLGCDQDSGIVEVFNSILYLNSLVSGKTYYIQVDKWGGNNSMVSAGSFGIEVHDMGTLAAPTVDQQGFLVYPNPVNTVLNLTYNSNIEKILVYNLLGQEVGAKSNADNTQIDMSSLASGTYLVKISSGDKVKTMKVVKE